MLDRASASQDALLVQPTVKEGLQVGLDVSEFAVACLKHAFFDSVRPFLSRHCLVEFFDGFQPRLIGRGAAKKKSVL